ncbi:MAG TPA: alkaline phosphatase family protein, partial [Candidatus Sulfotelmatobacter sp.]|nr:alkaline phosphatase family protein [Candidatus Sulfotelmatobacter sp.]
MRDRLLVLGLDAADRDLVRGWAEDGDLPCLAKLLESGVTIPVSTPPAVLEGAVWPTLITGSSPASHGMFATLKIKPGTYEVEEAMRADRLPTPPFWAQLSRAGKRVAVIDAPFARPVRGLNGIQVTNWGAHDAWAWPRSSWPARLVRDLVRRFGPHPVPRCDSPGRSLHDYESLRDCLISGVEKKTALLRHCLALEDWDLFFGIFSESHCAGHQLWHLMDSEHPRHAPEAPHSLRDALRAVYRALDAGLAALLDAVPPGTHILLLLSHGMGPWYDGSHLLDALLDRLTQQLVRGAPRSGPTWSPHPARGLLWRGRACLPPLVRQKVRELFPGPVARLWTWTHPAPTFPWHTKSAFAMPSYNMTGGIRINLKGREPAGLVEPGRQYET